MFRLIAVLGLLLISGIVSVAASPSATVHASQATPNAGGDLVFVPIADALVEEASPNTNHGNSPRLRVDGGKDPAVESYLTFSVSDIPGPIGRAVLRLFATSDTKVGPAVYAAASDWSESGITWANRPSRTTDPVASTGPVTPDMWVEFDVTAVVTGNGTYNFVLATRSADGLNFSARESGQTAPQLVITPGDRSSSPVPVASPVSADTAIVLTAGDVTSCKSTAARSTGELISARQGAVLALGDLAYPTGTADQFRNCYDPVWGSFKNRTYPVPGNHEYMTAGAAGYYAYFGAAAGDPTKGYYSYDLGRWHIVALNSNCDAVGGCDAGSPQEQWLRADLAKHPAACTLAYMHFPLYSSGEHGNNPEVRPLWQALYDFNAELVLAGHDHDYERFAPQDANGKLNQNRGIRQFVVGTGGASHYHVGAPEPNSEIHNDTTFGVLELVLHPGGYDWTFLPAGDGTFADRGSGICHDANGPVATGDLPAGVQSRPIGVIALWRREPIGAFD
jgi:calcineurin-like phosphoesterase family protein